METMAFTTAKAHLSEIVDRVDREHDRVAITKNGRLAAVVLSAEELAALEETIDILSDPELVASLKRSLAEADADELYDLDDL